MTSPTLDARPNQVIVDRAAPPWDLLSAEMSSWFGGADGRFQPLTGGVRPEDDDGGIVGGIYRGIFGASAGDTYTSTGEAVPPWFWMALLVIGGAVVWRVTR